MAQHLDPSNPDQMGDWYANQPPEVTPHETMSDEGGSTISWLSAAYDKATIIEEFEYLDLTPEKLHDLWLCCRWTTDEEQADLDTLSCLGLDPEVHDTSVYYWRVSEGTPGAHHYWTTEP